MGKYRWDGSEDSDECVVTQKFKKKIKDPDKKWNSKKFNKR